jgi:hypothetical protein
MGTRGRLLHGVRMLAGLGIVIALLPVVAFVWDRRQRGRKPG